MWVRRSRAPRSAREGGDSTVARCAQQAGEGRLAAAGKQALAAVDHVIQWLEQDGDAVEVQPHARRIALTLGRALELALLVEHAAGEIDAESGRIAAAAAVRFATSPVDVM